MKKLMTVIAAVAMSFGLFAESASHFISFETADECVQDGKLVKTGWTGDASVIGLVGGYNYIGEDARRDADGEPGFAGGTDNDKCLKLETGSNQVVCTPGGDTDNVYFDQTVKFTGYEEAPTVTDGKIAVWMSGIESDDTVTGETNLYVTCAKVNAAGEATPTNICIGAYDIDVWHRVTIKSLGDIAANGGRAGFLVYIDGAQVGSFAGIADADALAEKFQSYSASGLLFPALDADDATVTAVAYQGIGELDDVAIDNLGPKFARFVEGTVAAVPNAILTLTDDQGNVITPDQDGKFQAAPGATLTFAYEAKDGYFFKGGVLVNEFEGKAAQGATFDFTDDLDAKVAVAKYADATTGEPLYAASLQEALNLCPAEDEVTLLTNEVLTAKLVIPAKFGAGSIILDENTITLAADQTVGIDILADGVTIDGGTIASALTENVAGSKAINIPNVNVALTDVAIDAAHYEYAIYANCDDACVAAGDKLDWFYTDTTGKFATLVCDGVSITGNGSLFHVEGMTATLKDCSATRDANALFANAAHCAAVYSAVNATTTIIGEGSYEHVNALQSGNLGGKIIVAEGSTATFKGDIKSWMKVGAHTELEELEDYVASFTFNAGTYDGAIVFVDGAARDLDKFVKGASVVLTAPEGYIWDNDTTLVAIQEVTPVVTIDDPIVKYVDDMQFPTVNVDGYTLTTDYTVAWTPNAITEPTAGTTNTYTATVTMTGKYTGTGTATLQVYKEAEEPTPVIPQVVPGADIDIPTGADVNNFVALVESKKAEILKAPEGATVDTATYNGYFTAAVVGDKVEFVLNKDGEAAIQANANSEIVKIKPNEIAALTTEKGDFKVETTIPGFYYAVKQGNGIGNMKVVEAGVLATDDKGVNLVFKKYQGAGFYQIIVSEKQIPAEN